MALEKNEVRIQIVMLLEEHMGIDPQLALQDTEFKALHKDFDSLAYLELQLLLEKKFGMEFDGIDRNEKLPTNVSEMADALIREHGLYHLRKARKVALQAQKASATS
jgi:acyl carrier protein